MFTAANSYSYALAARQNNVLVLWTTKIIVFFSFCLSFWIEKYLVEMRREYLGILLMAIHKIYGTYLHIPCSWPLCLFLTSCSNASIRLFCLLHYLTNEIKLLSCKTFISSTSWWTWWRWFWAITSIVLNASCTMRWTCISFKKWCIT